MKISIKYFCLFTFLLMEFAAMASFAYCPEPVFYSDRTELKKKPFLTACFVIARRRDCEGFGICKVDISWRTVPPNGAIANFYLSDAGTAMVIEIDKAKGLTPENYSKYFRSGIYLMEDEFPIPTEVAKGIGLNSSRTLIAGQHKIVEKEGKIFLSIPFK